MGKYFWGRERNENEDLSVGGSRFTLVQCFLYNPRPPVSSPSYPLSALPVLIVPSLSPLPRPHVRRSLPPLRQARPRRRVSIPTPTLTRPRTHLPCLLQPTVLQRRVREPRRHFPVRINNKQRTPFPILALHHERSGRLTRRSRSPPFRTRTSAQRQPEDSPCPPL